MKALVDRPARRLYAEIDAPHGHDAFLLDNPQYHALVRAYFDSVASDRRTTRRSASAPRSRGKVEERDRAGAPRRLRDHRELDHAGRAACSTSGCGDGSLLAYLARERGVTGYGVEIADAGVLASVRNGVNVLQSDLESGLAGFDDASFDCVILSQTLQAMRHTEEIVAEMLRVGREVIVTFPELRTLVASLADPARPHAGVRRRCRTSGTTRPTSTCARWPTSTRSCASATAWSRTASCSPAGTRCSVLPNLLGELAIYRFRRA